MPLARGARLGPYEISGLLGAEGMGEVYRARDTRLGRDVAALNHSHVLTVHDVGTHDGTPNVVSELLEGENLRAVRDPKSATGWTIELGPFPGWKSVPTW